MQCFRYLKKRWKVGEPSCSTWEPAVWHGLWLGFHKTFSTFMFKESMLLSSIENCMQKSVLNMNGIKYFFICNFFSYIFCIRVAFSGLFQRSFKSLWVLNIQTLFLAALTPWFKAAAENPTCRRKQNYFWKNFSFQSSREQWKNFETM